MSEMEQLKGLVDGHSVISFDVFDTLLLRPFVIPSDLFDYMEVKYRLEGFGKSRKYVKVNSSDEKTIEDIYNSLPQKYRCVMEKELLEEELLIYQNQTMMDVFQYALEKQKKIVILSDIYFHKEFVEKLLLKNGYSGFTKIYCSCDYNKTKCNGALFKTMLDDIRCDAKEVLHIGDNDVSDYAVPKSMGVESWLIRRNYDVYCDYRPYVEGIKDNFWDSILIKLCSDDFANNSTTKSKELECWEHFGFDVAGPICWTFAKWINEMVAQESSITDLAFVARDGYLIKKMFDLMNHTRTVQTHYVYAPRILATLFQENFKNPKDMQKLTKEEVESINSTYGIEELSPEKRIEYIHNIEKQYHVYLKNEKFGSGVIGVVDSTTNNLSSQKLINYFSDRETCGLYWFASQYAASSDYSMKTCQEEHYVVVNSVDLFELIFKSPEPTIKCFSADDGVVFNEINQSEKYRIEAFNAIEKGAMRFYYSIENKELCGYPNAKTINSYLNRYCANPLPSEQPFIEKGYSSGGIANAIWTKTKVFTDSSDRTLSKKNVLKEIKKRLTKSPKLFMFLRTIYHKIK